MTNLSRRAMIASAPAIAAAAVAGQAAAPPAPEHETESPILCLFRTWQAKLPELDEHEWMSEDYQAVRAELHTIERQMIMLPSTCAADVAAKLISHTCDGRFVPNLMIGYDRPTALMRELRALVA